MLIFFLRLIGIGKILLDLIVKYWKVTLPTIAFVAQFFVVSNIYYTKGVNTEKEYWKSLVTKEAVRNDKLSDSLATSVMTNSNIVNSKILSLSKLGIEHRSTIETIIREKPVYRECVIDKDALDLLNASRVVPK